MNNGGFTLGGKTARELGLIMLRESQRPILAPTVDRTLVIAGRHGAYDFGADLAPKEFNLECAIIKRSPVGLQTAIEVLGTHLLDSSGRPRRLDLVFDLRSDRAYSVRLSGQLSIERIVGVGKFTLPLVAYDPFSYSLDDTSNINVDSNMSVDSNLPIEFEYSYQITSPTAVDINNFGALAARPIVEITGSFTSLSLTLGGKTLAYNAPVTNQTLVLNFENYTAKIGSTNVLGNISGDFFDLPAGINAVQVGGSDLNCSIEFIFKPKYL